MLPFTLSSSMCSCLYGLCLFSRLSLALCTAFFLLFSWDDLRRLWTVNRVRTRAAIVELVVYLYLLELFRASWWESHSDVVF